MAEVGVVWVEPPEKMAEALEQGLKQILVMLYGTVARAGQDMQNDARRDVSWEDRTSNARGGLFFVVDGLGQGTVVGDVNPGDQAAFDRDRETGEGEGGDDDTLLLILGHSMYYGQFLELAHGQKYAIVMPTIEANLPDLKRALEELFR